MLEFILVVEILLVHTKPVLFLNYGLFGTYWDLRLSFEWFTVSIMSVVLFVVDYDSFTVGLSHFMHSLLVSRIL